MIINNNELSTSGAMPLKDNVADGTNTFSLFRHRLTKSPAFFKENTRTQTEIKQKKWYGNSANRDSSLIVNRRNNEEVGLVSKNVDNARMTFTSHTNRNDVSQAISRARSRGYVVPPKFRYRDTPTIEEEEEDYYTPQPFNTILKSANSASAPSTVATSFTPFNRYMIKYGTSYLTIDASFDLVLTSNLATNADILPKVFEVSRDPSNSVASFRIDSDLDSLYSLDFSNGALRFSNNWGQGANLSNGYVRFDYSGNNLIVKGRQKVKDVSYNRDADFDFSTEIGNYVYYDAGSKRFKLTSTKASAATFTLYKSPIQADMPSEFNPFGIPYQPNSRVSIKKYIGAGAKNTIQNMDAKVKQDLSSTYLGQVDVSGWSVKTDISASSMLDTIFSTVQREGNSLRYDKSVYKLFRAAALKTTLACNAIADGTLGQNTVPYVYFTNDVSNGVHHPFMVMASYSISDKPNRLLDVCRPPADGNPYATSDVTRDATLQNYLVKIPMLDYGLVTSCTSSDKNIMLKTLLSDATAQDKIGITTDTPYNYASISAIGVAVDGVVIYPVANNTLHPAQAQAEITNTGIHVGRGMGLHYHADGHGARQNNLNLYNIADYESRNHPPLIGFGFDGIALYGQYDSTFPDMLGYSTDLDVFGGHSHGNYGYHYHAHTVASTQTDGMTSAPSGVNGATLTPSSYNLRILMKGAWKGRINSIPEFWDQAQSAPSYTMGTNNSVYTGYKV